MSNHSGLRYLFKQPNLNLTKVRWFPTLSELDFKIKYIKVKDNQVASSLSRNVKVNHIAAMTYYETELQDMILQVGQWDDKYMDIMHVLQQSTGAGIGIGDQDADYRLTTDGLVRFRDMIYVPNCSEIKKLISSEFHSKPYLGHPGYQNMLMTMKKFYYQTNLKKEVAQFIARCLY